MTIDAEIWSKLPQLSTGCLGERRSIFGYSEGNYMSLGNIDESDAAKEK
jgi:hypothetical protein